MPLAERVIEPSILGGQPINVQESRDGEAHLTVATNCLVGVLYQLANIVRQADDIFCDISDECQKVLDRTQNINQKILHIQRHVQNLDAKNVNIPVGSLSSYSRSDDHHTAKHGFEIDLFTVDSRPHCISDRYNVANQTPACKLRGADLYRKDGLCTERLFRLWPIVLNEHKVRTPDLNLPRKMQSVFTFEKKYKRLKSRPKTITSLDELYNEDEKKDQETEKPYDVPRFPPSEKVTVDTSAKSFQQMESFRQALLHIEREDAKKKKKRKSVSGVPEDIMKEIEKFEKKRRSTSGHDVKDYLFDDLDETINSVNRDEEMAKYFDEIDAKIEDRIEEEVLMKERKIMKFLPCKRSKSLPRCVRLYKPNEKRQSVVGNIKSEGSSLSLASNGTCASRISRSTKRSSIISNKFRILVSGNAKSPVGEKPRPRPKSLDLDAIDFNDDMSRSNLARTKMPSMPDGVFNNTTAEMRKNIGPGTYYNFESNTLPRRQTRRSESPWEYLPKDWTSSVKLREINKGRAKEDRQSSSGHWSGTNSNRHSLDSDNVKSDYIPNSNSQISLGQDSGRGSPLPQDERGSTDTNGGYIGDGGSTVTDGTSVQEAKLDSDNWLRTLAIRAASRDEVSTSSAETLNSLTRLTKQNIEALDLMMSPSRRKPRLIEDDLCSEYSVDQEGFYTSFHNDSGLRKSSATLVDEDELSRSKDSHSVCSFDSVIHNPDSDQFATIKKNQNSNAINKVTPPKPPKRTSSVSSVTSKSQPKQMSPGDFSRQDSIFSDTDQETFFQRVENKSKISSNGIPSMCSVTSDDESFFGKEGGTSSEGEIFSYEKDSCRIVEVNQNFDATGTIDPSSLSQISEGRTLISGSSMDGISVFTINSDQSTFNFSQNEVECKTLPRKLLPEMEGKYETSEYTKSWPRSNKKGDSKFTLASILKNSDSELKNPKSIYFSPTLNLFDSLKGTDEASSTTSTQEPKTASKEELEKMGDNSSYMLTIPMAGEGTEESKPDLPTKYQPVLVVKPGVGKNENVQESKSSYDNGHSLKSDSRKGSLKVNIQDTCSFAITGNQNTKTEIKTVESTKFAITGNPRNESMTNNSDNTLTYTNMTSLTNFSESINSLNSELSMADSLTYVSMPSSCSSPNLSNMDIPAVLTPTGSVDSLHDTNKKCSDSVDNSNLSTTMETIAITTNSYSSFNSSVEDEQKSFRTFSADMIPMSQPFSTSTPYTSSAGKFYQGSFNQEHESPVSYSNKHSSDQNVTRMSSSKSVPSNMKNAVQNDNISSKRQNENISSKRHSIGSKPHPVVNLNHMDDSDQSNQSHRTDSYRVAMVHPTRSGSYRVAMNEKASYPSFNNESKRSTTPRVNVTNMISHDQQPLHYNQSYDQKQSQQINPDQHYKSYYGQQTVAGSGKGRYNPLYASVTDSISQGQKQSHSQQRRNSHERQQSPARSHTKHPSPLQGHRPKEMSVKGNYPKEASPSLSQMSISSQSRHNQGHYPKEPSPSLSQRSSSSLSRKGHTEQASRYELSENKKYSEKMSSRLNRSDPIPEKINTTQMKSNMSTPALNSNDRTESYRVALGMENPARNSSYRVAMKDTDPLIPDSRLDVIDTIMSSGRDSRRMGITNIDQVKSVPQQATERKDSIPDTQQVVKRRKPDVDPISVLSNRESSSSKTNKNRFSTSSTFIQFDPISEDWEFMMNTSDTMSNFSNDSDRSLLDQSGIVSRETVKVNGMSTGKTNQEKSSSSSLLGSIKSTLKSMSGKQSKDLQEDGRYSVV